ncbi:MAG TPA: FAD-dependent oxidoreductase, partial [Planctomycetes bacterium]|nr:FAD-dependent oxidoreductase [Planctomycetota bacterium]
MVPYNEKVWERDLNTMASDWVAGRVPEAPIEDILRSSIGVDTEGYTHQSVFWFPLHGGFEAMVKGTVQDGGFDLQCNIEVQRVEKTAGGFKVNGNDYDLVVNTVPLPQIEGAIQDIPENIRKDIQALKPISL